MIAVNRTTDGKTPLAHYKEFSRRLAKGMLFDKALKHLPLFPCAAQFPGATGKSKRDQETVRNDEPNKKKGDAR